MKTVLIIDDDLTMMKQISTLLSGHYRVMMAKSGRQGLDIALERAPDLVLLDVAMPVMDGLETIREFKKNSRLAPIPIIFLTASRDTETQVKALSAGGVDYLTKPAEREQLLHRLDLHLKLARHQRELEAAARELENSIVVTFAELIECRDSNSGGHVLRTREYMRLLGQLLLEKNLLPGELDQVSLETMVQGTALHDIGKIGISDLILFKPGALSPEEYEIAKQHIAIGAKTLEAIEARTSISFFPEAIVMARHHHERYDGSGYPDGLRGAEIPLSCRMLYVANTYDKLVSPTAYRPPFSHDQALDIISQGVGTETDPLIAGVFIENHHLFQNMALKLFCERSDPAALSRPPGAGPENFGPGTFRPELRS
ncbi:MAG: response regulator [Candidatus Adiutrix sp.]|jgi:putative two-component system response regulator|nr:response regulator [Candidatus Adiutrix sp.]